ncbi:MAG: hypothetical protein ABSD28_06505 [Tepidisphaeraceae bacterium]|jgi:hypothetical protein
MVKAPEPTIARRHAEFAARVDALVTPALTVSTAIIEDWNASQRQRDIAEMQRRQDAGEIRGRPGARVTNIGVKLSGDRPIDDELGKAVAAIALRDFHPGWTDKPKVHPPSRYYDAEFAGSARRNPDRWEDYFAALERELGHNAPSSRTSGDEEWSSPTTLKEMAGRLGVGGKAAKSQLKPHGLKNHNGNRQQWIVCFDKMPSEMRQMFTAQKG